MKDDRAIKINKERAYAQSMLYNAIRINGQSEAFRVRDELDSILKVVMCNVTIFSQIENYEHSVLKNKNIAVVPNSAIENIFKGVSDAILDTLLVMAKNRDMKLLIGIHDAYNSLFEKTYKKTIVDVITAVELDDHLRELITKKVQNELDTDVILHEKVSKDILGGVIIQAKNRIIDCSVKSMLIRAGNELTSIHQNG